MAMGESEKMDVETGPTAGAEAADGGDVADARDPDVIQREIEQTRAELADTIDAIADRLSPKRAAGRGAAAVKAQVSSVIDRGSQLVGGHDDDDEPAPASLLDADQTHGVRRIAIEGGGTQYTGTSQFSVSRSLRTDRVLILVGAGAVVAAVVVLRRARR
jgi:hypothetical protein